MFDQVFVMNFLSTLIYVTLGMVLFAFSFWLVTKISPVSVRKEIEDDQNSALAIIIGAVFIGIAIIIAAAIH
jgi:uncharacterized membrane protein YjfL (UPF0719 family)